MTSSIAAVFDPTERYVHCPPSAPYGTGHFCPIGADGGQVGSNVSLLADPDGDGVADLTMIMAGITSAELVL
ncbi:hypothetical protein [Niveispirillum fermenti]|uniref:hypothetical protein n=1 Tax=Niveispirillum fermenti TaxID=1233113 RepID=UPI003A87579F